MHDIFYPEEAEPGAGSDQSAAWRWPFAVCDVVIFSVVVQAVLPEGVAPAAYGGPGRCDVN